MKHINLLIKPASGNCNLRCKYCFYHDITEIREVGNYGIINESLMENMIKKTLNTAKISATFAFQGGEPTLAGIEFFKKVVNLQKKYNVSNININNAIQTNGTLIDDEWASFLAENKFLTGISLDGTKDIHDLNRLDAKGCGSFTRVIHAIELFDKYGAEYNILTVVSKTVAKHINKVFKFFEKNNFKFLQFIPCLDPLEDTPGGKVYSLTPDLYGEFLIKLFELYYKAAIDNKYISIRFFDNLVEMLMGHPPESCGMLGICSCQFVIEGNGNVYPCDFYCIDKYLMGNISQNSLEELFYSPAAQNFIKDSYHMASACGNCRFYNICRGGCKRYREPFIDGKPGLSYFCDSYKTFFEKCLPGLQQLAVKFRR